MKPRVKEKPALARATTLIALLGLAGCASTGGTRPEPVAVSHTGGGDL